jgi:branched-chain amino acid transport system permease protein
MKPDSDTAAGAVGAPRGRIFAALVPLLLVALLAAFPFLGLGPNTLRLIFATLVLATASVAWNLLGGFGGQVSFGFSVFYGLGAYAAALAINGGLGPMLAFVVAAAVAVLASLVVGLPTFRLRGPYFAIATIGVSEAVRVLMTNLPLTGGASGYRVIEQGPFRPLEHYYSALALVVIAVAVSMFVRRSKLGLALFAVREDEEAAADLGVNPFRTKLVAHGLAAALTGAAGGVHARYAGFITPQGDFAFQISVAMLLMPIIGGVGTIWGPVIGAVIYGFVHEQVVAAFPEVHLLIYGALLILIVLFEPAGIMGLAHRIQRWWRRRRADGFHPQA